jgi:hypothetical protein
VTYSFFILLYPPLPLSFLNRVAALEPCEAALFYGRPPHRLLALPLPADAERCCLYFAVAAPQTREGSVLSGQVRPSCRTSRPGTRTDAGRSAAGTGGMLCSFFFPFAWPASTLPFSFVVSATTCSFSYQPAAGRMGSIQGWARTSVLLEHEQILAVTTSPCAGGTASLQSSEQSSSMLCRGEIRQAPPGSPNRHGRRASRLPASVGTL